MSDNEEAPAAEETTTPPVAKVGVKDQGHDVTTAGGIIMNGLIADLADGDHK